MRNIKNVTPALVRQSATTPKIHSKIISEKSPAGPKTKKKITIVPKWKKTC
jgi:hypothetical protein